MKTGAIELVDESEGWRIGVGVQRTVFMATEAMDPVRAVAEIPAEMQEEKLETFELRETGREEKDRPWKAGETGVASGRKAQMIGVAEAVAEVAGETAIEESVVGSLAVGLEIGAREGVIESAEEASDQTTAARGGIAAAFGEEIEFGNARGAAMAEELDDARNRIRAVESAFGAVDDFELVDVVEGLVGKIEEAAGFVEWRAVNEEFCEIGVAAIEEKGGETSFAAGASDGGARKSAESIGERDELTLADFVGREDIDGSRSLADFERLGVGGDDDIFGDLRDFELDVESTRI